MITLEDIKNSIKKNMLSHLYLINAFSPKERLDFAIKMSLLILGDEISQKNINKILEGVMDNIFIFNLTSSFKVDTVDALYKEFNMTASNDKPRIFIIESIDNLSDIVLNKLLKFLEEPVSQKTYGLLLCGNKDQVISTILSRAQIINLNNYDAYQFSLNLEQEHNFETLDALILGLCNFSIEDAKNMYNGPVYDKIKKAFVAFVQSLTKKDSLIKSFNAKELYDFKPNLVNLLDLMMVFYTDILSYKNGMGLYFKIFNIEIKKISNHYSVENLNKIIVLIVEKRKILNYMINIDLQINDLILELDKYIK